jgi:hypothetical protein
MTAQNPLEGMTKLDCATACNRERCVISKRPFCFHPLKGAMTFAFTDPAVVSAYAEACEVLGVKNIHQFETGNEVS